MFAYINLCRYFFHAKTIFIRRTSNAIGDNILLSSLLPDLRKKHPRHKIIVETPLPDIFCNNPHVDWVTSKHIMTTQRHTKPKYRVVGHNAVPLTTQMRAYFGLNGPSSPRLYLSSEEISAARRRLDFPYIAICPTGKTSFSANRKEWGGENFQKLVNLFTDSRFVQVGLAKDPLLSNVTDRRGLTLRKSAAVIANADLFIGLEGGLMHMAKAVGTKAAIIYGGYIEPQVSAYDDNLNIYSPVDCSPCCSSHQAASECPSMICMKQIHPERVYQQITEYLYSRIDDRENADSQVLAL